MDRFSNVEGTCHVRHITSRVCTDILERKTSKYFKIQESDTLNLPFSKHILEFLSKIANQILVRQVTSAFIQKKFRLKRNSSRKVIDR